jgi:hypothetical protein
MIAAKRPFATYGKINPMFDVAKIRNRITAPNHLAAAAKLYADFLVTDIFHVGSTDVASK